jgi:hypothetical protein
MAWWMNEPRNLFTHICSTVCAPSNIVICEGQEWTVADFHDIWIYRIIASVYLLLDMHAKNQFTQTKIQLMKN